MNQLDDKDIEKYVVDKILDLNQLFEDKKKFYEQTTLVLNGIKTVNTLEINSLKHNKLLLSLVKCEFKIVEITDTYIKKLKITNDGLDLFKENPVPYKPQNYCYLKIRSSNIKSIEMANSSLKEISLANCEKVSRLNITQNPNLERCYFGDTKIQWLTLENQNKIKKITIAGKKEITFLRLSKLIINSDEARVVINCPIKEIKIFESKFNTNLNIGSNELQEVNIDKKCTFKSLTINHKNANIKIDDCTVEEKLDIGSESTEANSSNFEFTNNTIGRGITFGKKEHKQKISKRFKIENNRLQTGKWKFYGFSLDGNCNSEITEQSFDDVTFQNCDFSNFDFQHTDIHLAEIIDSNWKEVDIGSQKRIQFKAENEALEISDLKELKKQYSFFRKKFEDENNYVDASKFKISEALTRIKIEKRGRKLLLYFNKWLNMFGESIARPFKCYVATLVFFAILYLFSGIGKDINFDWYVFIDSTNLDVPRCSDFFESLLFSFKNISPVKLEYNFDFTPSRPTQIISMFQKLINIILVGALIASMRNFFRK